MSFPSATSARAFLLISMVMGKDREATRSDVNCMVQRYIIREALPIFVTYGIIL